MAKSKNIYASTAVFRSHANFDIGTDVEIMDYCILGERNPYPDVFENESDTGLFNALYMSLYLAR